MLFLVHVSNYLSQDEVYFINSKSKHEIESSFKCPYSQVISITRARLKHEISNNKAA